MAIGQSSFWKTPVARLIAGATAGMVATWPMTCVMQFIHRRLPRCAQKGLPPFRLVGECFDTSNRPSHFRPEARPAGALPAHYAYGAVMGSCSAVVSPSPKSLVARGIGFGLGVWAVSYGVAMPLLHLEEAAQRQPLVRNTMMVAAHVVWGGVLGALLAAAARPPRQTERCPAVPSEAKKPSSRQTFEATPS
jgi:hypothetical protein